MADDVHITLSPDNLRSLLHALGAEMDQRFAVLRQGSGYANVRPSDVRVFAQVALGATTVSDVARILRISRQAVHMSARRLQALGVIALTQAANNKRERQMTLTEKGRSATSLAHQHTQVLDHEFSSVIGGDGVETLRKTLKILLDQLRQQNGKDTLTLLE